jgi:hypothetical protein
MAMACGEIARVGSAAFTAAANNVRRQKAIRAGKALGNRIDELKLIQTLARIVQEIDGRNVHKFSCQRD